MEFKKNYAYGGWNNCIFIANKVIDIVATSDVGPRIIRCGFVGKKNLFLEIENDIGKTGGKDYRLYGGARLWHSPELKPRSYYPDNKKIDYEYDGNNLRLLQPTETKTGMQKEINIKLDEEKAKAEIVYKIYNRNLWPIEFAPWALTLMAKGGRAIIPHEPYQDWTENLLPVRPLVLWSYTRMNDERWLWGSRYIQLKQKTNLNTPQKIGLLNKKCWEAYYLEGYVFIKRYNFKPLKNYPDFQCNTEIYTDSNLFELETLGPLEVVEPEGYLEHKENWYLFETNMSEDEQSIDENLLPLLDKLEIPE